MNSGAFPRENIVEASTPDVWGTDLRPFGCPSCRHGFLIRKIAEGFICPDCAKGNLAEQAALLREEPPELILAFEIDQEKLKEKYNQFCSNLWLPHRDFKAANLLARARHVFWPMWLLDARVRGTWQAEIGFNYQVKSTQEIFRNASWQSVEQVETRVRWEQRAGTFDRMINNQVIPALSEHEEFLSRLGTYDFHKASPFNTSLLNNTAIRIADIHPENAWPGGKNALDRQALSECQKAANGDHHRNGRLIADYGDLHWTSFLLPMVVSYYYKDNGEPVTVWINGQTGWMSGQRLSSQEKGWRWAGINALIALLLAITGVIILVIASALPVISLIGGFFVLAAIALGIFAIVCAIHPWQWNRNQAGP